MLNVIEIVGEVVVGNDEEVRTTIYEVVGVEGVSKIEVAEYYDEELLISYIYVTHTHGDVYGDEDFAEMIGELLDMEVDFTEAGMQQEGLASLEAI